ncbi:MAG: FAD-dependent oxidoreductase [Deltaproteobacteria bacterium]|nr:FAD-dependent oxidoreductase [Deltaproteobacteria bacterium]
MDRYDVIVIGGGISGTSLAHACARAGLSVLVAEKTDAPGGCIHSHRLESGYWFELGAHTCYNSYRALLEALESKNALDKLLPRAKVPFRLLSNGKVRSIASELSLLSLLAHVPSILFASKEGRTVRDYYEPLVGRGNYERVFGPLFAAVPSQSADEFPSDMLFKKRERRKELPRSFTLTGGLQTVVDVLLDAPKLTLLLNAEAVAIERQAEQFVVRFADGSEHRGRFLAMAIPPNAGARLLKPGFPALADALSHIQVTRLSSIGVALPRRATPLEPLAFLIPLDQRFYSAVSRDTVPDPTYRAFAFHLKPELSLDEGLRLICQTLHTDREQLEHVVQRHVELPSPRLGHPGIVREIDQAIAGQPLFVTGNYFGGLAIEDCVLRSNAEAARLLKAAGAAA